MAGLRYVVLLLAGLFSLVAPVTAADLKIYGSDTIGGALAPALVKAWLREQGYSQTDELRNGDILSLTGRDAAGKSLNVELQTLGSSTGFAALNAQRADIAMSSRTIKPSEVAALKKFGRCDTSACEYVLGLDGIAIIVHPKNPLARLDVATLRGIFSGQIKDWKQVGGDGGAIRVYALDNLSGTYDTFAQLVLGGAALEATARRDSSHEAIAKAVAADSNAIGFVGLPFASGSKVLAVMEEGTQAVAPSAFSVATEDYALARRLYFYLPEQRASALASRFVEFAVSDAGQTLVAQNGFVSQAVLGGEARIADSAPDEYRQLTAKAQRLSLNFRFVEGMATLDSKSQRDVERLVQFMKQPGNQARKIMLFGFADSNESLPIVSLQLSMDRADTVADLLIKKGVRPITVRGYGSVAPVASNTTAEGRFRNRRVEVWLR